MCSLFYLLAGNPNKFQLENNKRISHPQPHLGGVLLLLLCLLSSSSSLCNGFFAGAEWLTDEEEQWGASPLFGASFRRRSRRNWQYYSKFYCPIVQLGGCKWLLNTIEGIEFSFPHIYIFPAVLHRHFSYLFSYPPPYSYSSLFKSNSMSLIKFLGGCGDEKAF